MRAVAALLVFTTLLLVGPEELAARPPQAQAAAEHETVLRAIPVSEAPRLDGVLDEPLWKDAPLFDRFLQQVPDEGKPATERTEVRIVYTRDKLYFGVVVLYSEPNKIIADELRRDSPGRMHVRDDTFAIILDTFHDHRNGYLFTVNALGARDDWACTEEGRHWNRYWDPVWDVATRVGPDSWSAEVEIPFKSLRYDCISIRILIFSSMGSAASRRRRRALARKSLSASLLLSGLTVFTTNLLQDPAPLLVETVPFQNLREALHGERRLIEKECNSYSIFGSVQLHHYSDEVLPSQFTRPVSNVP